MEKKRRGKAQRRKRYCFESLVKMQMVAAVCPLIESFFCQGDDLTV